MSNIELFKNNVDFYSVEYRDFDLKPWERKILFQVEGNVLDIACGGGRMTVPMLRKGCNVTGMDYVSEFEPKILAHRHEFKGKFGFAKGDMLDSLPFNDNSFDCVTCINSLVYLRDRYEVRFALKEMARVLKPKGKLFITSWNMFHPKWGTSILLNYLTRRVRKFGQTSPYFTTDKRLRNSKVRMYVPDKHTLEYLLTKAGIEGKVCTSGQYIDMKGIGKHFTPNIVITGEKC